MLNNNLTALQMQKKQIEGEMSKLPVKMSHGASSGRGGRLLTKREVSELRQSLENSLEQTDKQIKSVKLKLFMQKKVN